MREDIKGLVLSVPVEAKKVGSKHVTLPRQPVAYVLIPRDIPAFKTLREADLACSNDQAVCPLFSGDWEAEGVN
jgi:hypothetical protein